MTVSLQMPGPTWTGGYNAPMNKNSLTVALVALVLGIVLGWFAHALLATAPATSDAAGAGTNVSAANASSAHVEATNASSANTQASSSADGPASSATLDSAGAGVSEGSGAQSSSGSSEGSQTGAARSSQTEQDEESSGKATTSTHSSLKETSGKSSISGASVVEDGTYTSKDEVAAYIHQFGHLPSNYISKSKAKKAGWVSNKGNLDDVLPGMSIGGSEFYNDEGQLPDAPGRTWTECDINYAGGYRGAERIVFSNDGLIFYTSDHYETFEQLY